jgi:hypothetical protein
MLAILGCIAIIWGAVTFTLSQAHDAAVDSARRETATLARAFAESSNRISTVLDRELLAMRASFAEKGSAFDLPLWVRTQSSPDHMILHLGITPLRCLVWVVTTCSTRPQSFPGSVERRFLVPA